MGLCLFHAESPPVLIVFFAVRVTFCNRDRTRRWSQPGQVPDGFCARLPAAHLVRSVRWTDSNVFRNQVSRRWNIRPWLLRGLGFPRPRVSPLQRHRIRISPAWIYAISPQSLRRFLSSFPRSMSCFAKETEQDGGGNLGTVASFFRAPLLGASP